MYYFTLFYFTLLGSILGPLLFLFFIIEIFSSSIYLSFILFADDINISYKHRNILNCVI